MRSFLIFGLVVVVLFLSGCGGGGNSSNTSSGSFLSDASVGADENLNFLVLSNSATATEQQKEAVDYIALYAESDGVDNINSELNAKEEYQVEDWKVVDFNVFNNLDSLESFIFYQYYKKSDNYASSKRPEKIDLGNLKLIPNLKTLTFTSSDLTLFKNLGELTTLDTVIYEGYDIASSTELLAESKAKNLNISIENENSIDISIGANNFIESLSISSAYLKKFPDLSALSNLKTLNLNDIYATNDDLSNLGEIETLETLWIDSGNSAMYKTNLLPKLISLKKLTIKGGSMDSQLANNLFGNNGNLNSVEELYISLSPKISETDYENFPINLKKLSLNNRLTEIPDLKNLSNLEYLDLRINIITAVDWSNIPTSVTTLDLSSNQISTLNGIEVLTNLEYLYVDGNFLSSIAVATILPNIKYVSAIGNTGGSFTYGQLKK